MFYVKYRPGKTILRHFHVKGLVRHKHFLNLLLAPGFSGFLLAYFYFSAVKTGQFALIVKLVLCAVVAHGPQKDVWKWPKYQ